MNLALFLRVLGRFKYVVAAGLVAAFVLGALAYVRVGLEDGKPHVAYRAEEQWQSTATLFVTQQGFPWGRAVLDEVVAAGPKAEGGYVPRFADVNRFQTLAQLYAALALGDEVRSIILRDGPINGAYDAAPVRTEDNSAFLPLISIAGYGSSPARAQELASRAAGALVAYLEITQTRAGIAPEKRIELQLVEGPSGASVVQGRRATTPIFIFVLVMSATILLVFGLENLRPRVPREDVLVVHAPTHVTAAGRKTA